MNRIRSSKTGLPITLTKTLAFDDRGNELFAVPKILVFLSKETVDIGSIGSRNVKTFNGNSQVQGYIPSVYGIEAPKLDLYVGQLIKARKEINIVGYLKRRARGQLKGVLIGSSSYLNDENGPHTGWIKINVTSYKVEPVKDITK